jgi:IS605 OrfB family transposase
MKTTLKIKLCPTQEQFEALKTTMESFNSACSFTAEIAFNQKCFSKFKLQTLVYRTLRDKFLLSSQMAVRAIGKVVDAYRKDKSKQISFKIHGAVIYDQRIMAFKKLERVSLLTLAGRQLMPIILGGYQLQRMRHVKGQADLVLVDKVFYLLCTVEVPEPPTDKPTQYIGVDLGIVQIATDSTGETFSGDKIETKRQQISKLRSALQSKETRSAKKHLKKLKRKESLFRRDVNHCISKKLVEKAKDSISAIALEDLTGIRKNTTVRKSQRAKHFGWSFYQLRSFISYKAAMKGVQVVLVDPKDTSRECSVCGYTDKKNRKSQAKFKCLSCGHAENADFNAAKVISKRAEVNQPIVSNNLQKVA